MLKKDKQGKAYTVYRNQLEFSAWLLNENAGKASLTVYYQGCSDGGFCYPPSECTITLFIDKNLGLKSLALSKSIPKKPKIAKTILRPQQAGIQQLFTHKNMGWLMFGFFVMGLLLAFTPCVLPMVPVLSGIIIGQGQKTSTLRAFLISLTYVTSMALTYALLGIAFARLGQNLQVMLQTPLAISIFSSIFVLLALSMFGLYDLKLPDKLTNKINRLAHLGRQSSVYFGSAIMGMLSTLILSPCVTAPLVGAFSYIAQSGNTTLGALSLLSMGFGMGTPLLIIGTSAGKLLPKAGTWMNTIKGFFGVMLLAVALYLAQRILPSELTMLLTALLLIVPSLFLGVLSRTPIKPVAIVLKGLGLTMFTYGILVLIGLSQGGNNPIYPLRFEQASISTKQTWTNIQRVTTIKELNHAFANAKGQIIFLDYYASWCTSCKIMESTIFKDSDITSKLNQLSWIKVDVSDNSTDSIALEKRFNVIAPPTFIFLNSRGEELARLVGEVDKSTFLKVLKEINP